MYKEQLLREALALPPNAIEYHVSQILATRFPTKVLVEGGEGLFNVEEYAMAQLCEVEQNTIVYNQVVTRWHGREMPSTPLPLPFRLAGSMMNSGPTAGPVSEEQELFDRSKNAWLSVKWQGHSFDIVLMNWGDGMRHIYHYWIVADDGDAARDFIKAVCRWNVEVRGEVLVFDGGCWRKDAILFNAIKGSTFDNLILQGSLKQDIYDDLKQFFAARETYQTYGVPWKRGILFVGPPGNGKTHAVKAIINAMDQPCLYVKSFRAEHSTDEDCIRAVFDRARKSAPCILVLEDLDSLLNAQNRSFFLNELDGFAANIGVVTLATTNHPERLDPAIVDRPSRFDRKYPFDLPETPERIAYINLWNSTLQPNLRLTDEQGVKLGELTESFSFAYLKELFLSSMMRWIANPQQGNIEQVMTAQVSVLRDQMVSANAQAAIEPGQETQQPMGRMLTPRIIYRSSR